MPALSELIRPALRIAGVTQRPGITPSTDQYDELVAATNRLLGSWNVNGHTIFTTKIQEFALVAARKEYTIGPGGAFNTDRPMYIKDANILYPTSPLVRYPLELYDSHQWARITIQDLATAPPCVLYYDRDFAAGLGKIYLWPQPPTGYRLELFSWSSLPQFSSTSDEVTLPPGYEEAIVENLALSAARLFRMPISSDMRAAAARSLQALITYNSIMPKLTTDPMLVARGSFGPGVVGGVSSSSGGADLVTFAITGTINGTNGSDGNDTFTLDQIPDVLLLFKNGVLQEEDASYTLSDNTIVFLPPNIPVAPSDGPPDRLIAKGTVQ